jgi:flagellar basal body rod protein FlgG
MPPTNGLTAAAGALRYWERRQEITAHNLANVATDGFKGEKAFARLLGDATPVAEARTDRSSGSFRPTGNPLDVAIGGDGFLVVRTAAGERLSRGGALRLDEQHRLVDVGGRPVLGEAGEVTLPPNATGVTIGADGRVTVDGRAVAQLRLERVAPNAQLVREGESLFVPDATRAPVPAGERRIRQASIEESNVSPIGAMVEMITVQRAYASIQKAVTTLDEIRGTAVSDLGRPV